MPLALGKGCLKTRRPPDVSGSLVARTLAGMATEDTGAAKGAKGPLELDLRIEPGAGLSGTVAPRSDRAPVTSFSGWLGLAEAIDVLRREAGHPLASPKRPGAAEGGPSA